MAKRTTFTPSPAFPMAKAHYDALQDAARLASDKLRAVPGISSGPMGLTPDAVKFSPEYRQAKASYERLASIARDFTRTYVRMFKRELAAERAERRAAMIAARTA